MNNYTQTEINKRRELVKPIVQAVHSRRGYTLSEDELSKHAGHWEALLNVVPTNQLRTVYHEGLAKRCTTAEQFAMIWEMKRDAEWREAEWEARQKAIAETPKVNVIPDFIKKAWGLKETK